MSEIDSQRTPGACIIVGRIRPLLSVGYLDLHKGSRTLLFIGFWSPGALETREKKVVNLRVWINWLETGLGAHIKHPGVSEMDSERQFHPV